MNLELWIPLALSVATATVVALRRVFADFATVIRLLTQLREDTKICQVGIEALRLVDTDTSTKLHQIEERLEDLERFLQLYTQGQERPYVIRRSGK